MQIYSGFDIQKKVQQRKANTGTVNNLWTGKTASSSKRKSQFNKTNSKSNSVYTNASNNEKVLRFLSFCTFLCMAVLGSQFLITRPNFNAEAAGLDDVKIFTVYRQSPENTQQNSTNFELVEIPAPVESSSSSSSSQSTQALPTSATTTVKTTAPTTYKIKSGDNLSTIANTFKVDVNLLKQWNNITDPRSLRVGQEIIVKQL